MLDVSAMDIATGGKKNKEKGGLDFLCSAIIGGFIGVFIGWGTADRPKPNKEISFKTHTFVSI